MDGFIPDTSVEYEVITSKVTIHLTTRGKLISVQMVHIHEGEKEVHVPLS
jgi:hypothetical protein